MTRTPEPVLVERRGATAVVTINRPDRRNAVDTTVKEALRDALETLADDASVRAVVLAGAGGHFCAGQDLAEHAAALDADPDHAFETVERHYSPIVATLATMPKPVIAAVEGVCVGAGLGFALASDLRVVSTRATLATAFSTIGLTCDSGLAYTLPRAVGEARARELILLAEPLTGEKANELGLVSRQTQPGEALSGALELADRLAAGPTCAYAETKALISDGFGRSLTETLRREGLAQARLGSTVDHQGAVKAFLSKEKPTYTGA